MSLQVGTKTQVEQPVSATAPESVKKAPIGYSEVSILSSKTQNATIEHDENVCVRVFKRIVRAVWYVISFQWLCGKSKKNESQVSADKTAPKPVSSKTETSSQDSSPVVTKSRQKADRQPLNAPSREIPLSKSEIEANQAEAFVSNFLTRVTYPLTEAQEKEFAAFMGTIQLKGTSAHAAEQLSEEMFKRAETAFNREIEKFKSLESLITKSNAAQVPEKTQLNEAVVDMLRTVAFCCSFTDHFEKLPVAYEDKVRQLAFNMLDRANATFKAVVARESTISKPAYWTWCLDRTSFAYTHELLDARTSGMYRFCRERFGAPVVWTYPRGAKPYCGRIPEKRDFLFGWNSFHHFQYVPGSWLKDNRIPKCLKDIQHYVGD